MSSVDIAPSLYYKQIKNVNTGVQTGTAVTYNTTSYMHRETLSKAASHNTGIQQKQ